MYSFSMHDWIYSFVVAVFGVRANAFFARIEKILLIKPVWRSFIGGQLLYESEMNIYEFILISLLM